MALCITIICAVLYTVAITKYIKHNKTTSIAQRRQNNIEIRLMFYAVIMFVCLTVYALYQLSVAYFSYMNNGAAIATLLTQYYLINDVFVMINPWSLLITCAAVPVPDYSVSTLSTCLGPHDPQKNMLRVPPYVLGAPQGSKGPPSRHRWGPPREGTLM
jgi:hypothetical protein